MKSSGSVEKQLYTQIALYLFPEENILQIKLSHAIKMNGCLNSTE